MEKEIVAGAIFLLTLISPTPTPPAQTSQTSQIEEMQIYSVEEEDSLISIAKKELGSEDFWTNIWNNNSWIENPSLIEENWKLKIRNEKSGETQEAEELKPELKEKLKSLAINVFPIIAISQPQASTAAASTTTQTSPKPTITVTTGPLNDIQINFLGNCESGMSAGRNSGNGYFGAFQFAPGTWASMGTGYERADLAPLEVQIEATQRLVQRSNIFTQFPGCAAKMRDLGLL